MKRHIPNAITCCNLISGCIAIVLAIYGSKMAIWFILLGAVFDFFDGMVARLLGVQSPIGKELDSLADVITFGAAPSAMVFHALIYLTGFISSDFLRTVIPFLAFIIAAFSALRLAKFNLDERQTTSFIGLPTPANAMFCSALLVGMSSHLTPNVYSLSLILVLILVSSWLLVSEIPMFALKFKHWNWHGNEIKYLFVISCIPIILMFKIIGIAIIIAWYVVLSIITKYHKTA